MHTNMLILFIIITVIGLIYIRIYVAADGLVDVQLYNFVIIIYSKYYYRNPSNNKIIIIIFIFLH